MDISFPKIVVANFREITIESFSEIGVVLLPSNMGSEKISKNSGSTPAEVIWKVFPS